MLKLRKKAFAFQKSGIKYFTFLPFLALLLMLVCASASFGKTLFEEDFEKGIDEDVWNPHETWEVVDGVLDWTAPEAWSVGYTVKNDFTNFFMFADIKIGTNAAFAVRVQDDQNYYMFQYDIAWDPNLTFWHRFINGNVEVEELPVEISPEVDKWYRWKLIAEGYHFELYIGESDEELELAGTWDDEGETFDSGAIGFWQYGGETFYDNVLVTDLKGAAVVNKRNGLATLWGKIKSRY